METYRFESNNFTIYFRFFFRNRASLFPSFEKYLQVKGKNDSANMLLIVSQILISEKYSMILLLVIQLARQCCKNASPDSGVISFDLFSAVIPHMFN